MYTRGAIFQMVNLDLSTAGSRDFNSAASVVIFVRAEDAAGGLALDARVDVQLGDIASQAIPAGVNALFKLRSATQMVRFSWAAQPGVTAYFLVSAGDELMVHAPPARQIVTQAMGTTVAAGQFAVGNVVAVEVAPATASRQKVTIRNASASATVYLGAAAVTAATGFPLAPGDAYTVEGTTADVWAIADMAGADVRVLTEG